MAEELVELAAKDVFVLRGVPVPENLETVNKLQEQGDSKDGENESLFTLDDEDKVHMNVSNYIYMCRTECQKWQLFIC